MPIKIDISRVPQDKLNNPDFLELYNGMQDIFESILAVNAFCIHEAGHVIYYQRAGVPIHSIVGPSITYEKEPILHPAQVRVTKGDVNALDKSTETTHTIAKVHAAGKTFALNLTSFPIGGEQIDIQNFEDYCDSVGVPKNERSAIWDKAEKEIKREITKPSNKREAWIEAYKIRLQLFDIPPPAEMSAGSPQQT